MVLIYFPPLSTDLREEDFWTCNPPSLQKCLHPPVPAGCSPLFAGLIEPQTRAELLVIWATCWRHSILLFQSQVKTSLCNCGLSLTGLGNCSVVFHFDFLVPENTHDKTQQVSFSIFTARQLPVNPGVPCRHWPSLFIVGNTLCLSYSFFFLTLFYFFFYFTILYWFCHTSTWIRHGCR